ncbi:MAG: C39 family peptidase [Elusimicrobia bacterium]|nr:C39 family peptidase [Elusimicrobiota bacterium]
MSQALLLALAIAGPAAAEPALPANFLPLPLVAQTTHYDCGAAALYSVLVYWGVYNGDETSLFPLLQTTPKDGTDPFHIVFGADHYGLKAGLSENMRLDDLRDALERGDTVIVDLQAWRDKKAKPLKWADDWDDGHYVVLSAMDAQYAYFMDPSAEGAYAYLPLTELLERWHDFEDRNGPIQRYRRLGVVIRGEPRKSSRPRGRPAKLIRME